MPYSLTFSESAAVTLCGLPRDRREPLLYDLRQLAEDPFLQSDYSVSNGDGRRVDYLLIGDFVVGFFLDHSVCEVRILDLTDAC